jgi:exosortase A-associated hydrolase 1
MRALFHFDCAGEALGASLDSGSKTVGVLIVTGGGQTRFGAHRGFAQLARSLSAAGYPVMRFDRRGVGDSSGIDPGFAESAADIAAAVDAFRAKAPGLDQIIGYGLCDGATALCLFHGDQAIDGLILANPWVVEAAANEPPPAAIGRHYREQLLSLAGWKRLLSGGINYRKALRGVLKIARKDPAEDSLAGAVAQKLTASSAPVHIILAKDDATAIGFEHEWRKGALVSLSTQDRFTCDSVDTDAHSFAHEGNFEALTASCLTALQRFEGAA